MDDNSSGTSSSSISVPVKKFDLPSATELNCLSALSKLSEISAREYEKLQSSAADEEKQLLLAANPYASLVSALGKNDKTPTATDFEKLIEVNQNQNLANAQMDNEKPVDMDVDEGYSHAVKEEKNLSDTESNQMNENENENDDCMWRPW
jgi:hypothetical protein